MFAERLNGVSHSVSVDRRSAWLSAAIMPTMPPEDSPTKCARPMSSLSMRPIASAASCGNDIALPAGGLVVSPQPRASNHSTR